METTTGHKRWPKQQDEIQWMEHELRRARHGAEWEKSAIAGDPRAVEVWLAKTRDKKSWAEIGKLYFPKLRLEARRSESRRAYQRVERYLENPNAPEFKGHRLKQLIQETFGVSAEDFRTFILKGRLPHSN
ncbi:MAG: hypothetical protein ACYDCD_06215 [Candidatus Acidiferrales bacterium]